MRSERWERNEYILFGTKTRIGEELYKNLFENFEKSLLNTKVCIVVGFSFRDEHINEIFKKALRKNKSLRVMIVSKGPKGVAKNLVKKEQILKKLTKEERIIPLRCSFGKEKAMKMIDNELYKTS